MKNRDDFLLDPDARPNNACEFQEEGSVSAGVTCDSVPDDPVDDLVQGDASIRGGQSAAICRCRDEVSVDECFEHGKRNPGSRARPER